MNKTIIFTPSDIYSCPSSVEEGPYYSELKNLGPLTSIGIHIPQLRSPLPVCVRYISPFFRPKINDIIQAERSIVLIENRPGPIVLGNSGHTINLPWHTFILRLERPTSIVKAQLLFSTTQLSDEKTKLFTPYIPNVYLNADIQSIGQTVLSFSVLKTPKRNRYASFEEDYQTIYNTFFNSVFDIKCNSSMKEYPVVWEDSNDLDTSLRQISTWSLDNVLSDNFYEGVDSITFEQISNYVLDGLAATAASIWGDE